MADWINKLTNLFGKGLDTRHLPAGFFTYQSPVDQVPPFRLHLRLESNGSGLLIINAHTTLHLNQTAAEFLYSFIQGTPPAEIAEQMSKRYHVTPQQALEDYQDLLDKINLLSTTQDIDPVEYLGIDQTEAYPADLSAPYRLDCALTYRTSDQERDTTPTGRVKRELLTAEWKIVLDKAWRAGIPHVLFTGGEPTTRPDLDELLTYAQSLGMVTGLLTDGLRLTAHNYLHDLLQRGLDHIMILLDDRNNRSWEAVRDVIAEDIFLTVHLTVDSKNSKRSQEILQRLQQMGVQNISLTAATQAETKAVKDLASMAAASGIKLVWDVPVPYSSFNPFQLEREDKHLTDGAGKGWLYVEPDGDVLPAQGIASVMGNLLTDEWAAVWKNRPAA
jgi:organic radical activating enzyme